MSSESKRGKNKRGDGEKTFVEMKVEKLPSLAKDKPADGSCSVNPKQNTPKERHTKTHPLKPLKLK